MMLFKTLTVMPSPKVQIENKQMEMAKSKTQMEKVVSLHIFALPARPIIKIQLLSGQLEQIFLQLDFSFGLYQLSQIFFYVEILKYPGK